MAQGFESRIPLDRLVGLRPSAWLCVGPGFSREDLKALILTGEGGAPGRGFTGEAITSLPSICVKIVAARKREFTAQRVLGGLARQEVLRILLAEPRLNATMPELKRLRRQGSFFKRLDAAMQGGRMAFAHEEEGGVYAERIDQRFGENPIRREIAQLSLAYEAWLSGSELMDPPLLMREASRILNEEGWPEDLQRPEEIHYFSGQTEESLERGLWDALGRHVRVVRTGPLEQAPVLREEVLGWDWQLWHTLDDAAEELASCIAREGWKDSVVLIPDASSARRSLRRALEGRGIPLADPRDPTRLKWDEGLKWATLPLEVVARGFERERVISFLRGYFFHDEFPRWAEEIKTRGIRQGLVAYAGGKLSAPHSFLNELSETFGGRRTCADLAEAHLKYLRTYVGTQESRLWILPFFEAIWREFVSDTARVGQGGRRAPLLYWWERLQARLSEAPAPVERLKAESGVAIYRLHQAPLSPVRKVWVFGLPSHWLGGEGVGDYWFSERERETLASEFSVRSGIQIRHERLRALTHWFAAAREVVFLDASYDVDGREREGVGAVLSEVASALGRGDLAPEKPRELGSHPRWLASYGALRPVQPQEVALPPLAPLAGNVLPEMTATDLDKYSRCSFLALAQSRWKLWDGREPDADLWADARGNILHEAVKVLIASRDENGAFTVSVSDALDRGWSEKRPKGMVRSTRVERYVKSRLIRVLEAFCEKEREYFERAPSKVISLDDQKFRLEEGGVAIVGTPDRIDEHREGIFVIDYKSSSVLPHGSDMVDLGYRLQLPFYALAARAKFGKPVLGVQFVTLNTTASRGSGIFFKKYNGKEPGKPTCLRANSKSLLVREPEDVWAQLEQTVADHARAYASGRFAARAKRPDKECSTCGVRDLCGFRRLSAEGGEAVVSE